MKYSTSDGRLTPTKTSDLGKALGVANVTRLVEQPAEADWLHLEPAPKASGQRLGPRRTAT